MRAVPIVLAALFVGCSGGTTSALTVLGYTVVIKSAPPTTAPAGTSIPIAFTVKAKESDGTTKPASGSPITFTVTAGGGTVGGASSVALTVQTDGSVSIIWVLGPSLGAQTLRGSVSATEFLDVSVTATPPVVSVSITLPSASLVAGTTEQVSAIPRDGAGNPLPDRAVAWSSSSAAVAAVSATGLVSALAPGTTTITATSEGVSAGASLTVTAVPVAAVTLAPTPGIVQVGSTLTLTPTLRDATNGILTGRVVTWQSSLPTVATVSATGVVSGIAPGGPVMITATSEGVSGSATVTVFAVGAVASIVFSGNPTTIQVNGAAFHAFKVDAHDAADNLISGRTITLRSSDPTVATVSPIAVSGGPSRPNIIGVAVGGPVTITATSAGVSAAFQISVDSAGLWISPSIVAFDIGQTAQLTATLKNGAGAPLLTPPVRWTALCPTTATVSSTGLLTALAPGICGTEADISGGQSLIVATMGYTVQCPRVAITLPAALSGTVTQQSCHVVLRTYSLFSDGYYGDNYSFSLASAGLVVVSTTPSDQDGRVYIRPANTNSSATPTFALPTDFPVTWLLPAGTFWLGVGRTAGVGGVSSTPYTTNVQLQSSPDPLPYPFCKEWVPAHLSVGADLTMTAACGAYWVTIPGGGTISITSIAFAARLVCMFDATQVSQASGPGGTATLTFAPGTSCAGGVQITSSDGRGVGSYHLTVTPPP